jgi:hypothetical protein
MGNVPLLGVPKWQIRILSREPVVINYAEQMREATLRPVMARTRTLIGRTSYMVNGPNREVKWSVERWVADGNAKPQWITVTQGRSTLKATAKPQ